MTARLRKQKERQRHRDAGRVQLSAWVPAHLKAECEAAIHAICHTPNAATVEALDDIAAGRVETFNTFEALMDDLNDTP